MVHGIESSHHVFIPKPRKIYGNNANSHIHKVNLNHKPLDKTITSILNIINTSNYVKNLNKIRITSSNENIRHITNEILQKCCSQNLFMNVFLRLLIDMIKLSGLGPLICEEISIFATNFYDKKEYVFEAPDQNKDNYDIFCLEQKHKINAIAKNIAIIAIFLKNIVPVDMNYYFRHFVDQLDDDKKHSTSCIDIILNILIDLTKVKDVACVLEKEHLFILQKKILQEGYSHINMKTTFLIEELKYIIEQLLSS
jgi:hypothetical protein